MTNNDLCGIKIHIEDMREKLQKMELYALNCYTRSPEGKTTHLTFGEALEAMKKGHKVRRAVWKPTIYCALQTRTETSKMTANYIYISVERPFGPHLEPVSYDHDAVLAEDWMIVKE